MSAQWYRIFIGDDAVAEDAIGELTDEFAAVLDKQDSAGDCALFERSASDGSVVFVSPGFAALAPELLKQFSAVECSKPPANTVCGSNEINLLVAVDPEKAWALLN